MSVRRVLGLLALVLVGAWLPVVGTASSAAAAVLPGYVTMVSESGDYIGGGISRSYRGDFSVRIHDNLVHVGAGGYSFEFVAPAERSLVPGRYPGATRYPFQDPGEPGLSIFGDGRGCNTLTGWFTVLDIAPDRVWIAYEQHCEGGDPALFGEIKLGAAYAQPELTVEAGVMGWPAEHPGVPVRPAPVRITNTGSATTTVSPVVAAGRQDFSIELNSCGTSLAPGSSCTVHVGFKPSRPGTRLGLLQVTDGRGQLREVSLSGVGIPGRTAWHMKGDSGDYISGGRSYDYTPIGGARLGGGGTETYAWMSADSGNDWWSASFQAPTGQILIPGRTYTGATRFPFNSGNAGLSISGSGRGCNELSGHFTVNEATYLDGRLTSFRISFEQHCEHATPALRGEVSWRAVDPNAPVPDTSAPTPVTDLAMGPAGAVVDLSWRNPTDPDWVDTVVIGTSGTSPSSTGRLVYDGRQERTTVTGFPTWHPYTLTAYAEDTSGNLSPLRSVTIPATTQPPSTPTPTPTPTPGPAPTSSPTPAPTPTPTATPAPTPAPAPAPSAPGTTAPVTVLPRSVDVLAERVSRRYVRLHAVADDWAAGSRVVLQRRGKSGWTRVATRRFSPHGTARWVLPTPARVVRYRAVTKVGGQRIASAPVRVSPRRPAARPDLVVRER